jgi:hypothetical protein
LVGSSLDAVIGNALARSIAKNGRKFSSVHAKDTGAINPHNKIFTKPLLCDQAML